MGPVGPWLPWMTVPGSTGRFYIVMCMEITEPTWTAGNYDSKQLYKLALLVNSWLLEKNMCCIIETLVRRDRSGMWSEHGRRARVIYNLETLETKELKTGFWTSATFYMVPATELGPTHFLTYHKLRVVPRTTNTMLGLMQYPQRVLLHKQQKGPRSFLAILKYVAAHQPTDRQFRYSNRPIRCFVQPDAWGTVARVQDFAWNSCGVLSEWPIVHRD